MVLAYTSVLLDRLVQLMVFQSPSACPQLNHQIAGKLQVLVPVVGAGHTLHKGKEREDSQLQAKASWMRAGWLPCTGSAWLLPAGVPAMTNRQGTTQQRNTREERKSAV